MKITTPQGEEIRIQEHGKLNVVFDYESFPSARFTILFNGKEAMFDNYTAIAKVTEKEIRIHKDDVSIEDAGNYTVIGFNGQKSASTSVFVYVYSKPLVDLSPNETYIKYGSKVFLLCKVVGFPRSNIEWGYTKCSAKDWQSCIRGKLVSRSSEFETRFSRVLYVTNTPGGADQVKKNFQLDFHWML